MLKIAGKCIKDNGGILKECSEFYKNLYTTTNPNMKKINDYMSTCKLSNHLTEDQKDLCDKPISLKECMHVVENCMKPNKSPGLDGIPVEFYKAFWPVISNFLIEVYSEIFKEENLTYSQKTAVISLIFKTGDRSLLKNYRPISLTNTDYKILAFVLAMRVQKVMPSVINNDQTGYIKDRFIDLFICCFTSRSTARVIL